MKRIIIIILVVLGINLSIACRAANVINNLALSKNMTDQQKAELAEIIKHYKFLVKQLCDAEQYSPNNVYNQQTPQELGYKITATEKKLEAVIAQLKELYKRLGVSEQQASEEEKNLKKAFDYYFL